jgi:hypothetical protein
MDVLRIRIWQLLGGTLADETADPKGDAGETAAYNLKICG